MGFCGLSGNREINMMTMSINEEMFRFELASVTRQRRLEEFEIEFCNIETVLIKFVFS